jgi:hypothetical protein
MQGSGIDICMAISFIGSSSKIRCGNTAKGTNPWNKEKTGAKAPVQNNQTNIFFL